MMNSYFSKKVEFGAVQKVCTVVTLFPASFLLPGPASSMRFGFDKPRTSLPKFP